MTTFSRRSIVRRATLGGTAIFGVRAAAFPARVIAQDAPSPAYELVCIESNVRIRDEPSLTATVRAAVNKGDRVRLTGVSVERDGYRWMPVTAVDSVTNGWTPVDFFRLPDGGEIGLLPGTLVHVNSTRVNLRAGAGTTYEFVGNFNTGTQGVVNDGPVEADGFVWYNVTLDYVTGWIVEDYLTEGPYVATTTAAASESAARLVTWKVVAASDSPQAVKDTADYICDGIDDHLEIQAAIEALAANTNGGGTVWLSTGTFVNGGVVTHLSRISVKGLGGYNTLGSDDGGTTIRRQPGYIEGNLWEFEEAWWGAELGWLTFDGNKANVPSGTGSNVRLAYAAEGSDIHHVLSINARGDGFVVEGESTPANLRQCSAFNNDGWGFNLHQITRMVTLWNPSGDSNGAGLIRVHGPAQGAITSVVIHSPKGERIYRDGGNDPAIHIDDYAGPVTIVGGSLDGHGSSNSGSIGVRRSGSAHDVLTIMGLRVAGYTDYLVKDDTQVSASIPDSGNGWTNTINGCTTTGGFHYFGASGAQAPLTFSAPWNASATASGWYNETWVPANGISQDTFIQVSFANPIGGGWTVEAEPFLYQHYWYVLVRLWNRTGARAAPNPGTVYVRAMPR